MILQFIIRKAYLVLLLDSDIAPKTFLSPKMPIKLLVVKGTVSFSFFFACMVQHLCFGVFVTTGFLLSVMA